MNTYNFSLSTTRVYTRNFQVEANDFDEAIAMLSNLDTEGWEPGEFSDDLTILSCEGDDVFTVEDDDDDENEDDTVITADCNEDDTVESTVTPDDEELEIPENFIAALMQ